MNFVKNSDQLISFYESDNENTPWAGMINPRNFNTNSWESFNCSKTTGEKTRQTEEVVYRHVDQIVHLLDNTAMHVFSSVPRLMSGDRTLQFLLLKSGSTFMKAMVICMCHVVLDSDI